MLEVRGLSIQVGSLRIGGGLSFSVGMGESLAITGGSGSGKTLVLKSVIGLLGPSRGVIVEGEMRLCGERVEPENPPVNCRVGYAPQVFEDSIVLPRVADELVQAAIACGHSVDEALRRVRVELESLGLGDCLFRSTYSLSGGQLQAVTLLRALLFNPSIIVLDEPFTHIDEYRRRLLAEKAKVLLENGASLLAACHSTRDLEPIGVSKTLSLGESPCTPSLDMLELPPRRETGKVAVELQSVTCGYGGRTVLDNACLRIEDGEMVGIVGPNGAGKTTLTRLITGVLRPARGSVRVYGRDPSRIPDTQLPRLVGLVGQFPATQFFTSTVESELRLSASLSGTKWSVAERIAESLGLHPLMSACPHRLTRCQQQLLALAAALVWSPPMIIVDELHSCCDKMLVRRILEFLRRLRDELGFTVIVTTHDTGILEGLVDRIVRVENGVITE